MSESRELFQTALDKQINTSLKIKKIVRKLLV